MVWFVCLKHTYIGGNMNAPSKWYSGARPSIRTRRWTTAISSDIRKPNNGEINESLASGKITLDKYKVQKVDMQKLIAE